MEAQRHIYLQVCLQHFFSFSPVTTIRSRRSLHCGCYCIPMPYKSLFENSRSCFHQIRIVHYAVLRHMLLGILLQPCSQVGSEPGHQLSSGPDFFTSIGIFKIFHIVSKRSKYFIQASSSNCSLLGASCRLFSSS